MKKLYRKGTIHPSPSPTIADHLSFLPATILSLTLSLSPQDREVLAYLISCGSSNNFFGNPGILLHGDHPPLFNCTCFCCYMNFWVRWNSSPNHHLIHQILDAFEDSLPHATKPNTKDKTNKRASQPKPPHLTPSHFPSESVSETSTAAGYDEEKGSVTKLVSFIGERIWSAWAH